VLEICSKELPLSKEIKKSNYDSSNLDNRLIAVGGKLPKKELV
jgi:hypothetical protein